MFDVDWDSLRAERTDGYSHTCASCVLRYSCRRMLLVSGAARRSSADRANCVTQTSVV